MEEIPGMLGRSPAMRSLFEAMARVTGCDHDMVVHVHGETGTGKEKVARALHERSPRRRGPFVAVNGAGSSDELFEAQFFGHARGAFTGALADGPGHVAVAEGGTLFLDEVADLSLGNQARLLRFFQEWEYRRVGETRLRKADVRVLTAANADLSRRVAEGRFRQDLFFRLGMVLHVPPLRERGEDVLLLARHFLEREARAAGRPCPRGTVEFWRAVRGFDWPGNVRQLEHEVKRLVVMTEAAWLTRDHLAPEVAQARPAARVPLRSAMETFEREYLTRVLERHGGVRKAAAAALGITRQALHAKMRRLRIEDGRGPGPRPRGREARPPEGP